MRRNLEAKLAILEAQDVTIVDRRLTYFVVREERGFQAGTG